MESGGQIYWQVSLKSPFSWRFLCELVGVRAEAFAILGTMAADLVFNLWICRLFRIVSFRTYQGASIIFRRVFDWKRLRISMLDVDVVPQSCMP
jgi:hypothetical protein